MKMRSLVFVLYITLFCLHWLTAVTTTTMSVCQSLCSKDKQIRRTGFLKNKTSVTLQWIPSHCGVGGNEEADGFSFSFSSRWHRSARKGPYALRPSLSSLPKVALETVPIFVWLNTDRSRPWRVECRPLPLSTPLSFRRSML